MGRLPDKLIIVRHGARLDEALDDVHLRAFRNLEHGYDSPISYTGWRQSQTLGRYLARLILYPGNPDRRRKRIIIHSSPFTRCLQTSIGIASGFGEVVPASSDEEPPFSQVLTPEEEKIPYSELHTSTAGAHLETILSRTNSELQDYESITKDIKQDYSASEVASYHKILLRIEPWLREWISDTYFQPRHDEYLKPAAMLRRAANIMTTNKAADGVRAPIIQDDSEHWIEDFPHDINQEPGLFLREYEELAARDAPDPSAPFFKMDGTYNSPVPVHAILASDQIPRGYVAHARDACVLLDPAWGGVGVDRGYFPESWQSFHARIQGGLEALLRWYATYSDYQRKPSDGSLENAEGFIAQPFAQARLMEESRKPDGKKNLSEDNEKSMTDGLGNNGSGVERQLSCISLEEHSVEDDEEFIVILVTHAGGCNKLLHVLTQRPVFIDFPQASLTISVKTGDKNADHCHEMVPADLYNIILRGSIAYLGAKVVTRTIQDLVIEAQKKRQPAGESGRSSRRPTFSRRSTGEASVSGSLWGSPPKSGGSNSGANSAIAGANRGLWRPGGGNMKRRPSMRE